ncbi:MAG: hypothetical protein ABSH22_07345 [Tepidisphaeraceae bacterium]
MACFAVGCMMSWATYEMHQRIGTEVAVNHYRHDIDLMSGQQNDLAALLADPRTRLIRLDPVDQLSPLGAATVAWNKDRQRGAVFLGATATAASRRYLLWLVSNGGANSQTSFGPTQPGQAIYLFAAPPGIAVAPTEIFLTDWTPGDSQTGPALARGKIRIED